MALLTTPRTEPGWRAPEFELPGTDGRIWATEDVIGPNGLLVMFICNHCPYVQAIVRRLVADCEEIKTLGVGSVAIMPNDVKQVPADSMESMARFGEAHGFGFPYVMDTTQDVARAFDAVCTPDLFYLNALRQLVYRGRLDSGGAKAHPGPVKRELVDAVKAYVDRGAVGDGMPSMGCSIKWKRS